MCLKAEGCLISCRTGNITSNVMVFRKHIPVGIQNSVLQIELEKGSVQIYQNIILTAASLIVEILGSCLFFALKNTGFLNSFLFKERLECHSCYGR